MKKCSAWLITRETQTKTTVRYHTLHWSAWPSLKNLQITNAGEGVERREPSYTSSGNVNSYSYYGKQYVCVHGKSLQSFLTLCNTMTCSPIGSSVQEILQAKYWSGLPYPPLQETFLTQVSNLCLLCLLHWQGGSLPLVSPGKPHREQYGSSLKSKNKATI